MSKQVIQTFRCYGGPLAGLDVTEQYAGDDYIRYNAAGGQRPLYEEVELRDGTKGWRQLRGQFVNPKCILVYFPDVD